MAICTGCNQEMAFEETTDCKDNHFVLLDDGNIYPGVLYEDQDGRCHDCYIESGNYHHSGCDMERCPKCSGQLITCGCLKNKWYVDMNKIWGKS